MKTRRQKVFAILAACLLCASFFAVPVYAVDTLSTVTVQYEFYEYDMDHTGSGELNPDARPYSAVKLCSRFNDTPFAYLNTVTAFNDSIYPADEISTSSRFMDFVFNPPYSRSNFLIAYINQLFDDGVLRSYSVGDTLFLNPGDLDILPYDEESFFTEMRFVLRNYGDPYNFYFGEVVASTDVITVDMDYDTDYSFDTLAFNFLKDVESSDLCLCVEFKCNYTSDYVGLTIYSPAKYTISYGAGVSPGYPIYPSAPGGDDVGNLDSAEQELVQGSQQGLNSAADNFASFGNRLNSFYSCFLRITHYLNRLVGNTPYLDLVVWISLSLGIYASLLGLAGAIVSAADRKAGREAAAEKRKSKK